MKFVVPHVAELTRQDLVDLDWQRQPPFMEDLKGIARRCTEVLSQGVESSTGLFGAYVPDVFGHTNTGFEEMHCAQQQRVRRILVCLAEAGVVPSESE